MRAGRNTNGAVGPGIGPLTLVLSSLALVGLLAVLWPVAGALLPGNCPAGLEEHGGECVGVSDGGAVFSADLADVSRRIEEENERAGRGPHATIALMIALASDDKETRKQILHEVQGAYFAQYRANHDPAESGDPPRIRLVLAHPGKDRRHWKPVADRLAAMAASSRDNLRVVFGFDRSVRETKDAIRYLTNTKGIPVVGGSLTGSDFGNRDADHRQFNGFARVVPDNNEQAAALSSFDRTLDLRHAILVEDRRAGDDYVRSLRTAFERRMKSSPHEPLTFVSRGLDEESGLSGEFRRMTTNICAASPGVHLVYFAGRRTHLRQFVNALAAKRPCVDRPFTVVSGSDTSTLYADEQLLWDELRADPRTGKREVTVEYTSFSHPDGWASGRPPAGGSARPFQDLRSLAERAGEQPAGPVGPTDINDSRTASAYDSAWTAIQGIRIHTEGSDRLPGLRDIGDDWDSLQGVDKVDGASGWICLDSAGNPYNKALAVVRLDPVRRIPRFVGLAWPEGAPPAKDPRGNGYCAIPRRN